MGSDVTRIGVINGLYDLINHIEVKHRDLNRMPFMFVLCFTSRKWQDYVYIQCEYKSTKQKIKHLLREENKVKENKIS